MEKCKQTKNKSSSKSRVFLDGGDLPASASQVSTFHHLCDGFLAHTPSTRINKMRAVQTSFIKYFLWSKEELKYVNTSS